MSETVQCNLDLVVRLLRKVETDFTIAKDTPRIDLSAQLTLGDGANECDFAWAERRTLVASATDTLDVKGGTYVTDISGANVYPANVKLFVIRVVTTTAAYGLDIEELGGDSFIIGWADIDRGEGTEFRTKHHIGPGGMLLRFEPGADGLQLVESGSFSINNPSAGSVVYDIIFVGVKE